MDQSGSETRTQRQRQERVWRRRGGVKHASRWRAAYGGDRLQSQRRLQWQLRKHDEVSFGVSSSQFRLLLSGAEPCCRRGHRDAQHNTCRAALERRQTRHVSNYVVSRITAKNRRSGVQTERRLPLSDRHQVH